MEQQPPRAAYHEFKTVKEWTTTTDAQGRETRKEIEKQVDGTVDIALDGSDIAMELSLEHRRKGLMWFPTYQVEMTARYAFRNESDLERRVDMSFPLSSSNAMYDGFRVSDSTGKEVRVEIKEGLAQWSSTYAAGVRQEYTIHYKSRGTSEFRYLPTSGTGRVRNFKLSMDTDFDAINFPAGTISPSKHAAGIGKWHGEWAFESLVSSSPIGVELPQLINPGPLASRMTFFAPVGLLFFFFVVAVFASAKLVQIHPLNYFFFGMAFFAFHLLFGYLVDHLAIEPAFAIASFTSILLVVSYARLFVGWKFALLQMGISQLIYLVLFSFTFMWNGFTGLAITIGAILTLFVMMQVTGRVEWGKSLAEAGAKIRTA
jgi:hypothetical protein